MSQEGGAVVNEVPMRQEGIGEPGSGTCSREGREEKAMPTGKVQCPGERGTRVKDSRVSWAWDSVLRTYQ